MSIFDVRLRISDPAGFIAFAEVSTIGDIPSPEANQTAYKVTADGNYYSDGEVQELMVSDDRIQNWIDLVSEDYATCQAISAMKPQLLQKMQLVRSGTGAELTQYQSLKSTYDYLKEIEKDCNDYRKQKTGNTTGRMGTMKVPEIAGGEV